ncbi:type VII secretion integral membrane protein EccD [Mycobacterium sp. NPDC003449]
MPDALRRVSIHCGRVDDDPVTVDLALPASVPVGELMPSIVEACAADDAAPVNWRLYLACGPALDESGTLAHNDVHDGDLLLLARDTVPAPQRRTGSVTDALTTAVPTATAGPRLQVAGCLWSCLAAALALVWAGVATAGPGRFAIAALLAVGVTGAAVTAARMRAAPIVLTALNIAAVVEVAAFGFLIVPAGPGPANFVLAGAAAASAGIVMLRISDCGTTLLLAVVTFSAVSAVATGCAVVWPLGLQAIGSVLAATGLAALSLAPRVSIAVAELTPPVPGEPDADDAAADPADIAVLAARGHRTLTGLIAGCAAAAGLGAALVAAGARDRVSPATVAFTAAVGMALVLRSRSYAQGHCRTAFSVAGLLGLTATFFQIVMRSPQHGSWTGLLAVGAGMALLGPVAAGPAAARVVDGLEYLALATIVPLTCWLTGIFGVIRNLGPL